MRVTVIQFAPGVADADDGFASKGIGRETFRAHPGAPGEVVVIVIAAPPFLAAQFLCYDVWLPELAPTRELVAWAQEQPFTSARWSTFRRRYLAEMRQPAQQHLIALLAKLSQATDISVGCYCVDETRCHRSVLKELLTKAGAEII